MEEGAGTERRLSAAEAGQLRQKTEAISKLLQQQIEAHLETLRPLFAPRRLLGKYLGGSASRDAVPGAEKAVLALKKQFKKHAGPPFVIKGDLDERLFTNIENRVELYPWEYVHEAQAEGTAKSIVITSPVRWTMSYGSSFTLGQVRRVIAGELEKRPNELAQFVLNGLVMAAMIEEFENLARLLTDLRFEVSVEPLPQLGGLPLVTLSSNLSSFRPADDLLLSATEFSGVNAFIELVDRDAVESLRDPLREKLNEILG